MRNLSAKMSINIHALSVNLPQDTSPREFVCFLTSDLDLDGQLSAIHCLLYRHRQAASVDRNDLSDALNRSGETTGFQAEYASHEYNDLCHATIYQEAAYSMAALGMLAPFIETIFTECFKGFGRLFSAVNTAVPSDGRWRNSQNIYWDCHNIIEHGNCRRDLVKGILQLADEIELRRRLPDDIEKTLSALFSYRNKMFHCGFEWSKKDRQNFQNQIRDGKWPTHWFTTATSDGEPLIFYMSENFIDHCLSVINSVLIAFGELVRDRLYCEDRTISHTSLSRSMNA